MKSGSNNALAISSPRRRAAAATPRVVPVSSAQRRVSATAPRAGTSADVQRKRARPANLSGGPRDARLVAQRELGDPLHPDLERHPKLHPGEVRADTTMNAESERRVLVYLAVDDDLVGPLELVRVAVGGGEGQEHPVLPLHVAPLPVHVVLAQTSHRHRAV